MFKCASFFAGVGGIDYGFESTDAFTQWHLEMNLIMINSGGHYQSGVVPTLTANQGEVSTPPLTAVYIPQVLVLPSS